VPLFDHCYICDWAIVDEDHRYMPFVSHIFEMTDRPVMVML